MIHTIECRILGGCGLFFSLALFSGCGGGPPPPADKGEAAAVLRGVLEAWKSGQTPEQLKAARPSTTVVDSAWSNGAKLFQYEIDEADAKPSGYDVSCSAKLWIGDAKKPPVKIRYVIALKPALVVTRDFGS